MVEGLSTTHHGSTAFAMSSASKYKDLIDIPLSTRIKENVSSLFNFLDIYGPKIPLFHTIVCYFRLFQLIGCSFMAANPNVIDRSTLTFYIMNYLTILFHVLPVSNREGNEFILLYVVNIVLLMFIIYLIIIAFKYKKTTIVSKLETYILTIFMSFVPFLFIPISVQFAGQIFSALVEKIYAPSCNTIIPIVLTAINVFIYTYIIKNCYTMTLSFRCVSYQTLEGAAQCRLFNTTNIVTFFSSLTSYLAPYTSAGFMVVSMFCYLYNCTTCFNCGTFLSIRDQTLILGGSILGFLMSGASLYPILHVDEWGDYFFAAFSGLTIVVFYCTYIFIKRREAKDLHILDAYESTINFDVIKSKGKYKQLVITGFRNCHPICLDFSIFKTAVEKWPEDLSMWAIYAKFAAIYPEQSNCMSFIANNMRTCKADKDLIDQRIINIGQIIKTRETLFTIELKGRIAKLTKCFDKSRNRLRNIWDLVLQGNFGEMDRSNKSAFLSVNESEVEVNQLMMLYPNNRFVARQYFRFLSEIKLDYVNARLWKENYRLLQSGMQVNKDTLHDLGMIAFPNIPENCVNSFSSKVLITTTEGEIFQSEENIMADDDLDNQQLDTIKRLIDNHKVPALQFMKYFMIINLILFILIPFLSLFFCFSYFTDTLDEPLDYLYGIAEMRNLINVLPAIIGKYLLEELPDPKNRSQKLMEKTVLTKGFPLDAYGGYAESKEATEYLIAQVPKTTASLTSLRAYQVGNKHIEQVRTKIFSSILPFNIYKSSTEVIPTKTSMVQLVVLIATHCSKVLDFETVTVDVAGGLDAVTSRSNDVTATRTAGEAMSSIVEYIREVNAKNQKIFTGVMIGLILLCILSFFTLYQLQLKALKMNKEELYSVFSSLPKTVISNVSSSFSNAKQDSINSKINDSDINRQEDGIIKMFSSINDGTAGSIEIYNAFNVMFVAICACLGYFFILTSYQTASETLVKNCHHINYIYGSICNMFSLLSSILTILPSVYDESLKSLCPRPDVEMKVVREHIPLIVNYLHLLRFGGQDSYDIPFLGMEKALHASTDILHKNVDQKTVPKTIPDSAHQFSCELQIYLSIALLRRTALLMINETWPKLRDEGIEDLWQIGPYELYQAFYYNTGINLVPEIQGRIGKEKKPILICCVSLSLISLLFTVISLIMIHNEAKLMRFALLNLMRVKPTILFQNSRIMDVLSGNYSKSKNDEIERDLKFHNEVANKLNDIVIVVNEENNKILSANKAFEDTFKINEEDIIDTSITDFFVNDRFSSDDRVEKALHQTTVLTFVDSKENKNFIEFSTQSVAGRKIFSGRNITQTLLHEQMIADEKKRSDQMLASILPACLVPRVQAEEKNISFAIKSVTVLFLDVVEFTPWCGSHDAQYVMRMLNIMFKEYDLITNAHKTMTKIKCIGDCYMAAGGIFDEVNQPAVHAKEVVDFGCSVIKKLVEIDERENENLRIRVGINTGGPIIAGVIGTEKPTFEILGPAINIAHEMESKGVPMKVHISRPVYELIYGQQFDIKERGEIDIKGGKMFTYLVEP